MAPCFNNLRLVSTFRLTQRRRNVFVVRINTALWGQLSVNKPWCWQSDVGQEWTIRASAGDLQGYITRQGLWDARHLSGDLGSSTAFWVMICIMKHQSTLRGSLRGWWWWWGCSPARSKWDVTPHNLQNEAPAKAFHLEPLACTLPPPPSPRVSVIFTETGAKCFKRGDGNRPGGRVRGKCDYHQKNAMRPRVFNAQMHKKWYFITAWRLSKITGKGRKMCLRWRLWNACLTGRNRFNPDVSCPFHAKICFSDPWFD